MTNAETLKGNAFVSGIMLGLAIAFFALAVIVKWVFAVPFVVSMFMAHVFAVDADKAAKEIENGERKNA